MGLNSVSNFAIKYGDDFFNACAKTRGIVSKAFQKPTSIYPEAEDRVVAGKFQLEDILAEIDDFLAK